MPREVKTTTEEAHYRLLILGDGSVRTVPLKGTHWIIGRALDCTITLRDPTVSRQHIQLERTRDGFRFLDLDSANPPKLDGQPTRKGRLEVGQQLTIGLTQLVLEQRHRPAPVSTNQVGTVVLSREVIDEEGVLDEGGPDSPITAARVLESIEWTLADLGDLASAARPLLELALNLTKRQAGWLVRFIGRDGIETLAATTADGNAFQPTLPGSALHESRRIRQTHLLKTQEHGRVHDRLLIPLGADAAGLLVLEQPRPDAPAGQELLRLAQALGKVIWHRMEEAMERARLRDELERLRFHGTDAHNALLASTRLQAIRERLRSAASGDHAMLLVGEPGTEREELARYLHAESPRRGAPFVAWDAAGSAADKQPLELFGNGAYPGLLQRAVSGTLFVDNATAMPKELQQELAAALATAERADIRLVCAVAPAAADRDHWHDDLHATLQAPPVEIPPLRDDARDVLALSELFLSGLGDRPNGAPRLMTERTKQALTAHDWPGNVRELRLTIEHAAARAGNQAIAPRHLPDGVADKTFREAPALPSLEEVERQHIIEVMRRTGGVRARTAEILGIASSTLYEKLKRYRIE
ncbi:MAG TPA: sigma 54-dependent Fis family transcriptional regulator [bacterium]|nr:sigma 54-dependent Fis family transcriptional regulator [bacterium]